VNERYPKEGLYGKDRGRKRKGTRLSLEGEQGRVRGKRKFDSYDAAAWEGEGSPERARYGKDDILHSHLKERGRGKRKAACSWSCQ